jgi:uncharacterized protein YidB (DUF937 family)
MGLLDQVLGSLMGGGGANASPLQTVLTNMLAGAQQPGGGLGQSGLGHGGLGQGGLGQGGLGQGGIGPGGLAAGLGGLGGLIAMLEQAGLGNVVQSWVSSGPNQSVTPEQLNTALGESQVQSMSNQAGMAPGDFLEQLSQHLPKVVDGVTPNGRLPDEGTLSV